MDFKNLTQLVTYFKDENVAREYLVKLRWNGKPCCPYCSSDKVYSIENGKRYKCANKECYKKFSVTVGTIFENTKIPLSTWFAAIYIATSHKKGIASIQLAKDLGITQKSAWFVLHRIREMLKENAPVMLDGVVEIDETYIGGKEKNKHKSKRIKGTGMVAKTPMVGLLQRDGNVVLKVIGKGEANGENIKPIVRQVVSSDAVIVTDGFGAYKDLNKEFKGHGIVDHSGGEYVKGSFHTNTIEGFWSLLKRGIYGIYHQVSDKHLQRYCDEFSFRYVTRKSTEVERFDFAITNANGKRLTYLSLTEN